MLLLKIISGIVVSLAATTILGLVAFTRAMARNHGYRDQPKTPGSPPPPPRPSIGRR